MNKKILNEIDQMKYLFGYKRGVVISEQKSILKESDWPIDKIANGLKAGARGAGTKEQYFAQWLRGLKTFQDIKDLNKYFSERGDMSLEELIYDEFDADDDADQYWLKQFDAHFANKGIQTNFLGGQQGPIEDPGAEVATPQNSPENQPASGEPGAPPAKPKENVPDKEGWNEIVKHYNATPESYEVEKDDKIFVYKKCKITDNGKEYIIHNNGDIRSTKTNRYIGKWSWVNGAPELNFDISKITNKAIGYVSGDEEVNCYTEFCTNKKVAGRGARGYCVKEIQYWLLNSGLVDGIQLTKDLEACKANTNDCDGIYGAETEKAVRKFQEESNITVDGVVGCETWSYL